MLEELYLELEKTVFPKTTSRKNISDKPIEAFVLGKVNYRGQDCVNNKTKGPSRWNKIFPKLYRLIRKIIKNRFPNFKYTTIQLNKNIKSPPHIDKNNVGPSYIIGLGDYTGGNLVIEGKQYDIKNKWKKFDGRLGHWVESFTGTRYTLVFFTHTFKPPCPSLRSYIITKKGIYKKDKTGVKILIKEYDN